MQLLVDPVLIEERHAILPIWVGIVAPTVVPTVTSDIISGASF